MCSLEGAPLPKSSLAIELAALQARIESLEQEVRLLRHPYPHTDPDTLENLLSYIGDVFGEKSWAVAWLIEAAVENRLLLASIIRCVGLSPTVKGLSRFLGRHVGQWGKYVLRRTNPHSRDGVRYSVTLSPAHRGSLAPRRTIARN
jgi:hypothetical protein